MNLYMRLESIDVKGRSATISVDEFLEGSERTHATWNLGRNDAGALEWMLRIEGTVVAGGTARDLSSALDMLKTGTERELDATLVNSVQIGHGGLDSMGLWTAVSRFGVGLPLGEDTSAR